MSLNKYDVVFPHGTPAEDWQSRKEIFKAWHEQHKHTCDVCEVDPEDGSMACACAEYHLIRLLYYAVKGETLSTEELMRRANEAAKLPEVTNPTQEQLEEL